MSITLRDIAKMANVSKSTVSLALNGSTNVKPETKERILKIAEEHNYSINKLARNLARSRSGNIGVIVPDIQSEYYGHLVSCLDNAIRRYDYSMLLAISNNRAKLEKHAAINLVAQQVEGVLVAPVNNSNNELDYVDFLGTNEIPLVYLSAYYKGINKPCIMVDLERGTYKLVRYLLSLGHRNIIFMFGNKTIVPTISRVAGYRKAFEDEGIPIVEQNLIECEKIDYWYAFEETKRIIHTNKEIDAIITVNDMMALGVINALHGLGISVPDQISVAGYDNVAYSKVSHVPITTVSQNIASMCNEAVSMLLDEINNNNSSNKLILLPPELIIRQSTGNKIPDSSKELSNLT